MLVGAAQSAALDGSFVRGPSGCSSAREGETQHYSLARGSIVAYEPRNGATLGASLCPPQSGGALNYGLHAIYFLYYRVVTSLLTTTIREEAGLIISAGSLLAPPNQRYLAAGGITYY
ncbi:hypothetical protein CBS115989_5797 [Aspergillus niger]|nr:hypothetical protein CBS115989_5797 [Aspergillus niger]KAI2853912.1 hypothetical protein CBS11232_5224 [Aspergillus niger]KAI2874882.1 hypothetical protein CBS115988_5900 [Aspergillus niger]KAI2898277.1 hypothetical protein CBS11852_3651 [Aspergillus niger]